MDKKTDGLQPNSHRILKLERLTCENLNLVI